MLENTFQTKSCSDGYVILDDTGNPKSGNSTFATKRQWMGSLGKVDNGQVVVTSHYTDSRKDWPVEHRPYLPKDWVEEENKRHGEKVYEFKSKLDLGLELIDDLYQRDIKFSHLLVDSWYGNSPDFIRGLEKRKCLYITSLYSNRRVYFDLESCEKNEHQVKDQIISSFFRCFLFYKIH